MGKKKSYKKTKQNKLYILCAAAAALLAVVLVWVFSSGDSYTLRDAADPVATITMEDGSKIIVELYPDMAPNTVQNFIELANSGYYDGLIFHRVISGFMIQGGDPNGNGTGGPGYSIKGEFASNGYTANTLSHERGVISMAHSTAYDSAGSQFFIMHADAAYLDGEYAAFGKVVSGMEVVDEIASVNTNSSNKPLTEQVIKSIRVKYDADKYTSFEAEKIEG